MMTANDRCEVQSRVDESRYVLLDRSAAPPGQQEIGEEAYVDVEADGGTQRVLFHTAVSEDYAGQGLASVLVRAAIEDTIARGFRIVPVCPYVAKWFVKHPEYDEHVIAVTPAHLRAVAVAGNERATPSVALLTRQQTGS